MKYSIKIEERLYPSKIVSYYTIVLSIILALIFGAIVIISEGANPIKSYQAIFMGAFGSRYSLSETLVKTIPLILCGVGVAIAFRMILWNIGAEGQLHIGAFTASWVALTFPYLPIYILLPLMILAGFVGGALWALIPAILKAALKVNEIITTLLMNYIAILWVYYFVYGPWRDPKGYGFPLSAPFSVSAQLPRFGSSRVHLGLVFGIFAAIILYFVLKKTKWGYEIKVIGENPEAANYAGMNIFKNIILVMVISGGLAGLAGMCEVSGITRRLQPAISPGYGYTAIIIAWLAKLNPWVIILVSFLFGGLLVGGDQIQMTMGLPLAISHIIQGAILFFILGGETLNTYKIKIIKK